MGRTLARDGRAADVPRGTTRRMFHVEQFPAKLTQSDQPPPPNHKITPARGADDIPPTPMTRSGQFKKMKNCCKIETVCKIRDEKIDLYTDGGCDPRMSIPIRGLRVVEQYKPDRVLSTVGGLKKCPPECLELVLEDCHKKRYGLPFATWGDDIQTKLEVKLGCPLGKDKHPKRVYPCDAAPSALAILPSDTEERVTCSIMYASTSWGEVQVTDDSPEALVIGLNIFADQNCLPYEAALSAGGVRVCGVECFEVYGYHTMTFTVPAGHDCDEYDWYSEDETPPVPLCDCEFGFEARYVNWGSGGVTPPAGFIGLRGNRDTIQPTTADVVNEVTGEVYNAILEPNATAGGVDLIIGITPSIPTTTNGLPPVVFAVSGLTEDGTTYSYNMIYSATSSGIRRTYVGSNISKGYLQNTVDNCPDSYTVEFEPFFIGGSATDATILVNGVVTRSHPIQETMSVNVTAMSGGVALYSNQIVKNVCRTEACDDAEFKLGQTDTSLSIQLTAPSGANFFDIPQTVDITTAAGVTTWNLDNSANRLAEYSGAALTGAGTVDFTFETINADGVCKITAPLAFDFTVVPASCADPQYVFETIPQSPDGDGLDLGGLSGNYALSNGPATQWVIDKLNNGFEYIFLMMNSPVNGNKVWLKLIAGDATITSPTVVNVVDPVGGGTPSYGECGKSAFADLWEYGVTQGAHPDSYMGGGNYTVALTDDTLGGDMAAPNFYPDLQFYYGFAVKVQ